MQTLSVKDVSKSYNGRDCANTDISFDINEGEIVGFLGMNGAGKTTMLKSITGIHSYDSGTISVCGFDMQKQQIEAKKNFGYVPDNHATFEKLTGREYVNFCADVYGVSGKDRNRRIDFFLQKFHLEFAYDRQIKSYSHGMKQKIAITAAFIHDPKLWLLDEPMVGLDVSSQHEVLSIIQLAKQEGNSVFFSSHNLDTVEKLCDRAIVISGGKKVSEIVISDFVKNSPHSLEQEFINLVEAKA